MAIVEQRKNVVTFITHDLLTMIYSQVTMQECIGTRIYLECSHKTNLSAHCHRLVTKSVRISHLQCLNDTSLAFNISFAV